MHADQRFFFTFTYTLNCNLGKTTTGSVETHRGWRRLASFARSTGDTREHAPTALTALPEEVRGGSDLRRRGAARVLSRLCVGSHAMGSHAAVSAPEHVRRWAWGARLGGVQPVEHAVWRGTRTGETTSDRPPRRTVRVRVARHLHPPPDLDIVLSFLAAHPQSTPHKLIAVCWTGDRRRCSCGDELV